MSIKKITKLLSLFSVLVATLTLAGLIPVSLYAASSSEDNEIYRVVNNTSGTDVVDTNCKKLAIENYQSLLYWISSKTITCNNQEYINISPVFGNSNYGSDSFIPKSDQQALITNNKLDYYQASYRVKRLPDAGLRGEDFQVIKRVWIGTKLQNISSCAVPTNDSIQFVKSGKNFYELTNVCYKGKPYKIISAYIK